MIKRIGLFIGSLLYAVTYSCLMALIISVPYLWWRQTDSFWLSVSMFCIGFEILIIAILGGSMLAFAPFHLLIDNSRSLKKFIEAILIIMIVIIITIFGINIYYLFSYRPYNATTFDCALLTIVHIISFIMSLIGLGPND